MKSTLRPVVESIEHIDRRLSQKMAQGDYTGLEALLKARARAIAEIGCCPLAGGAEDEELIARLRSVYEAGKKLAGRLRELRLEAGKEFAEFARQRYVLRGLNRESGQGPARFDYTA
jgi:DNA-binding FadR family transcriptional regulator